MIKIKHHQTNRELAMLIQSMIMKGSNPGDIAVLSRNHKDLNELAEEMDKHGMDYNQIGKKQRLINSEEFRRLIAFLKLIVNPYDNFSFLLIRDIMSIDAEEYAGIRLEAAKTGKSHFQTWLKSKNNRQGFINFFTRKFGSFEECINLLEFLVITSWNELYFLGSLDFLKSWLPDHPDSTISSFLRWLYVFDLQDEIQRDKSMVQLMTIHAAKGLEFKTVILISANDGIIPSRQSIKADDIEPERRLFYVAITRAKDLLIATTKPDMLYAGQDKTISIPPSIFLNEMQTV